MSSKRYTDEFKVEAAKQVIDQGRPVREVAGRLGVSSARFLRRAMPMLRWRLRTGVYKPSSSG